MVHAKLSVRTGSTQITPEPGSWTFRGGWAPNQAARATVLLSVKFKKLPVLSWSGATARYSSLTTPVETSTAPYGRKVLGFRRGMVPGGDDKSEPAVGVRQLLGFGIGLAVGVHGDGSDFLFCHRAVVGAGLGGGDGIHHIHAGGHLAEGGILAV